MQSGQILIATSSNDASWEEIPQPDWTLSSNTWDYASSTTFTISGVDRTAIYRKGTRIKLTQSSTVKYFVVIESTYSGGDTTITIYAGADYALANSAISDNYYSYITIPSDYPYWFNDTNIILVADTGSTITSPTYNRQVASVIGKQVFVHFNASFTIGGTATPNVFLNLPIAMVNGFDNDAFGSISISDLSGTNSGIAMFDTSSRVSLRKYNSSNWATSGSPKVGSFFTYEI